MRNFIERVKTRKKPASDVETAIRSTATTHLANIGFGTGWTLRKNAQIEQVESGVETANFLTRQYHEPWAVSTIQRLYVH